MIRVFVFFFSHQWNFCCSFVRLVAMETLQRQEASRADLGLAWIMADATRVDNRGGVQSRLNGFSGKEKIGETGVIIITHALFRRIKSFANRRTVVVQVVANVSVSVNYSRVARLISQNCWTSSYIQVIGSRDANCLLLILFSSICKMYPSFFSSWTRYFFEYSK